MSDRTDGVRRNNKNNNGRNNGNNKRNNEEYAAKKAEILKKQEHNLDIINDVAAYLDGLLVAGTVESKITMQEVLAYLNEQKGYSVEETKVISQFNYLLLELANAQKSTYISGDRVNVRVLYIEERLKTAFKKELHDKIDKMLDEYSFLFYYQYPNDGEPIEVE